MQKKYHDHQNRRVFLLLLRFGASLLEWASCYEGPGFEASVCVSIWRHENISEYTHGWHCMYQWTRALNITDKCKTMGTLLPSKSTHLDTLTYSWDHFGKTNQWLSQKNVWRESLLQSLCCQLRHWLSCSGLLMLAKSALKSWWSLCRKRSSLCYGPDHCLSPVSPLHQLTWLNGARHQCKSWKSLPLYSSCWGNDGCFPQLK